MFLIQFNVFSLWLQKCIQEAIYLFIYLFWLQKGLLSYCFAFVLSDPLTILWKICSDFCSVFFVLLIS